MSQCVAFSVMLLAATSIACSDPDCLPGERKVGSVCYPSRTKLDAAASNAQSDAGKVEGDSSWLAQGATLPSANLDGSLATVEGGTEQAVPPQQAASPAAKDSAVIAVVEDPSTSATAERPDASTPAQLPPPAFVQDSGVGAGPISPPVPPPCVAGPVEICGDRIDNDCNGAVDEVAPEQCNGRDDDCNPSTADGAGACGTYVCKNAKCLTGCSADGDCVAGLHCANGTCEGTQIGAGCSGDPQCASGSCSAAAKCALPADVNGACNSAPDCKMGSACVEGLCKRESGTNACGADDECTSGVCVKTCFAKKREVGESCDTSTDCSPSLTCNSGQCKRSLGLACGGDAECLSGSCGTTGVCAATNGAGGACNSRPDCNGGLVCSSNICKLANGSVCAADTQCGEGTCVATGPGTIVCRAPAAFGELCAKDADCYSTQDGNYRLACASSKRCLVSYGGCLQNSE